MTDHNFAPQGTLALNPRAFGLAFMMPEPPKVEERDGVAVVSVRGPLMNRRDPFFDSYEAIRERVAAALEASPRGVILNLDSPGGVTAGLFEAVRDIRSKAAAAGVPLYAYVENQATSAAYALACAAELIGIPAAGTVGSIGVIDALIDRSDAEKAAGFRVQLIASGARKTDGSGPSTTDAIVATKDRVDAVAELFFSLVSEARGIAVDEIRALEAGLVIGSAAVAARLADQVMTFDELTALVARGPSSSTPITDNGETKMKASKAFEDAVATLRKMSSGDDEEAKKAKRMLAAELADDDAPPAKEEKKEDESAEGDEKKEEPAKEDEAKASKAEDEKPADEAKAIATQALDAVKAFRAEQAKATADAERRDLLAKRPDFSAEIRATLASASIEVVRDAVANWPRGVIRNPAAAASIAGTRGEGQGDGSASRLPPEEKRSLDSRMGLISTVAGVANEGTRLVLGAPVDVKR